MLHVDSAYKAHRIFEQASLEVVLDVSVMNKDIHFDNFKVDGRDWRVVYKRTGKKLKACKFKKSHVELVPRG